MTAFDPFADREDISPEGLAAARAFARWELGSEDWADAILRKYLDAAKRDAE